MIMISIKNIEMLAYNVKFLMTTIFYVVNNYHCAICDVLYNGMMIYDSL